MALAIAVPDHPLHSFHSLLLQIEFSSTLKHIQLLIEEAGDDFEHDPVQFTDRYLSQAHQAIHFALSILLVNVLEDSDIFVVCCSNF